MNELFRLKQTGKESGGACGGSAPYDVIFNRDCTVKEFIDYVLSEFLSEWGDIRIVDNNHKWYLCPKFEYRNGKGHFTNDFSDCDFSKKVLKATAIGGWSNMDYFLYTEEIEGEN